MEGWIVIRYSAVECYCVLFAYIIDLQKIKNLYLQTAKALESIARPSSILRLMVPKGRPRVSEISARL